MKNTETKEQLKQFCKETFFLMEREEATKMLMEKGYITEEGFVLHKFSDEVFDLGEKGVLKFEDATLLVCFDVKSHGPALWVNLVTTSNEVVYSMPIDNNDVYNLLFVTYSKLAMGTPAAMYLLYNTDVFCELMYMYKDSLTFNRAILRLKGDKSYSGASHPACTEISLEKYLEMKSKVAFWSDEQRESYDDMFEVYDNQFASGLLEPAKVVSLNPFVISCYTEQLDCVKLLRFPAVLASKYNLQVGDRLTTSNVFPSGIYDYDESLIIGPNSYGGFYDFKPRVSLFFAKSKRFCDFQVKMIEPSKWQRLDQLTEEYVKEKPDVVGNGLNFAF